MTQQNDGSREGGSPTNRGTDFTYVNEAFEKRIDTGETTVFGKDGIVTVTGDYPPPPNYDQGGNIVAYRGQPQKERWSRSRTMSEGTEGFSDGTLPDDEKDDSGSGTPPPSVHRMGRISIQPNNNYRRTSGMPRRGSTWSVGEFDEDVPRELILKIRKNLPLKDFTEEIRAHKDLAKFLVQPVVLLDLQDTSLETIIEKLMVKLQKDLEIDEKITGKAGKTFFTNHQPGIDSLASVDQLRETIQGVKYAREGTVYEETWITALCSLPMLKRSHVAIARLRHPLNLGNKCEEVSFVIAIVAPRKEKFTKNAVEVGRTFSSLMTNIHFRKRLTDATTEEEFRQVIKEQSEKHVQDVRKSLSEEPEGDEESFEDMGEYPFYHVGRGVFRDIKRRIPFYWSDFRDGVVGKNTLRKVISTTLFLYFACLLPDIAFGTLYEDNTKGKIDVTACIISQTFGGIIFALFAGQPLLVLLTTAPLALYVKVIYMVSDVMDVDFLTLYALVGLWNAFFIILQGCFHASRLMKYSTRSTEEIFAFFIALAFIADAMKSTVHNFEKNYNFRGSSNTSELLTNSSSVNSSLPAGCISDTECFRPENSVLFLFLMCGTLWLGLKVLQFEESQFLSSTKREMLADYALPISVIAFSFIGSYLFRLIELERFNYLPSKLSLTFAPLNDVGALPIVVAAGLGLCLSCLFFVDQNVSAALVNSPSHKLQKGTSYHWDLVVVGIINAVLSVFNLPWLHPALPHSPLHVRALADVEQHVTSLGSVHDQ